MSAAAWLEGFLNRSALILLHDDQVWSLVDGWLASLADGHFEGVLPIIRRSFAGFEAADRRSLGERARQTSGRGPVIDVVATETIDLQRAALALPVLRQILGAP